MNAQEKVTAIEGTSRVIARDNRVGTILLGDGKLVGADIERVMELQKIEGLRFGEAAVALGLISATDLHCAIAKQYDLPHLLPGNENIGSELVVAQEPFHPRAEEVRALRTQLSMRWSKAGVKHRVLAIVSPGPGEGRSYVAANLALAFAQLGERTLLIDADLRNPRQHTLFKLSEHGGLSGYLSGRPDSAPIVSIPAFPHLAVLAAGPAPPNPQELLSRSAFRMLLQELRASFDIMLFDTPTAGLSADAYAITMLAGGALILTRRHSTRIADARNLVQSFKGAGLTIVGAAVSDF